MRGHALVLGDDSRSCLTVVRSLGRKRIQVDLGVQELESIVPYSRYVSSVVHFPSSDAGLEEWIGCLRRTLKARPYDLVIPISDNALVPMAERRSELEPLARLAMPDAVGFLSTYRKRETLDLARRLDVPIPTTCFVEDLAGLEASPLAPPLIVKPDSSKVWVGGTKRELKVHLVRDEAELRSVVSELLAVTPVLLQRYVPGVGVGQEFLAKDGQILTAFQHQRVHEGGGGSSYRKSVPIDDRMLACSARMLAHLRWTGVAMVEYRWHETTGEFVLMEINGRFWGSLPLAVAAGVDFPADLYALLVEGRRPEPRPYRPEIYCRNLVKDVDWYRARRRADPKDPYLVRVPEIRTLDQVTNVLRGAEHWDTSTVDDPFPGLVEIGFLLRAQARKVAGALWLTAWGVVAATPWWRRRERTRLRRLVAMRPQLLFVCKGNVCRSPFAESYARAASARVGLQLALASVGTHRAEGRAAPEGAQAASLELGVSLGQHRSRMLTSERAQSAGALVCMDWQTRDRVVESFPEAAEKLFLLGPFARKLRGLEIRDPWGQPVEAFRRCYREIVAGVDAMLEALTETR